MKAKTHVGHKRYDSLLVSLLDEIASYRLREELLHFFCDELFELSSCDMIFVIDSYAEDGLSLFELKDRNKHRDLKSQITQNLTKLQLDKEIEQVQLDKFKKRQDAISYHTSFGRLSFLSYLVPASEYKQGGWATIVYLPRATPKHPDRYMILWYIGFTTAQIPTTMSQDERVMYLFVHYYKLASFNIKNKAKLIYEQRMEMLKALVPSMISHEIYHRTVTLYSSIDDLKKRSERILNASSLEEVAKETNKLQKTLQNAITPTIHTLTDITRAISKLTKQATTEDVNIKLVLEESILIMNSISSRLGIKLMLKSPDSHISTDRALLMHLVMNLISNSIEAYDGLKMDNKHILISVDNTDIDNLIIRVSDNAKGIPKEVVPRLFDEGFTTKVDGNGLGLAICSYIAGFLGGKISLCSYKKYKTTFEISLPRDGIKVTTLKEEI